MCKNSRGHEISEEMKSSIEAGINPSLKLSVGVDELNSVISKK